nr:hypothetical protein Itr_chr12CG01880 [Ipomoea trifida]
MFMQSAAYHEILYSTILNGFEHSDSPVLATPLCLSIDWNYSACGILIQKRCKFTCWDCNTSLDCSIVLENIIPMWLCAPLTFFNQYK